MSGTHNLNTRQGARSSPARSNSLPVDLKHVLTKLGTAGAGRFDHVASAASQRPLPPIKTRHVRAPSTSVEVLATLITAGLPPSFVDNFADILSPIDKNFTDSPTSYERPCSPPPPRSKPRRVVFSVLGGPQCTSPLGTIDETIVAPGLAAAVETLSTQARSEPTTSPPPPPAPCPCTNSPLAPTYSPGKVVHSATCCTSTDIPSLDLALNPLAPFHSSAFVISEKLNRAIPMRPEVRDIVRALTSPRDDWCAAEKFAFERRASSIGNLKDIFLRRTPFPRRRALIIGINYTGQKFKAGPIPDGKYGRARVQRSFDGTEAMDLETHEDARKIRDFIIAKGYKEDDIRMLLDEGTDPATQPTKRNIEDSMRWLAEDAYWDDELFFYFAGHGEQVYDQDGDEDDGMDESILPVDHNGDVDQDIVDDDIFEYMVKPLPAGCKLTALVDCCHSGTILDLPLEQRLNSIPSPAAASPARKATNTSRKNTARRGIMSRQATRKATIGCTYTVDRTNLEITGSCVWSSFPQRHTLGSAISISACTDAQVAFGSRIGGWMTNCFLRSLKDKPNPTYRELLQDITTRLNRIITRVSEKTGEEHPPQTVQLHSAHPLNLDSPFSL
ncbi:hypothetical protein BOTBODRAFT_61312 [Botryobasidium botryosum FD-172 SS1]|uniref:Peptidase C14 caspase domain-containing protein n=1 Tax=Botryobasidium botryosum (strain FD-172 SS1) TaxID=930990 RepID=A0A067N3X3_BOTB1|nr:hypothetical protein BOTBODRAFT_61312 [Botryobasidium botryosum FD-172 SS1]